jgi:hypothetical protein
MLSDHLLACFSFSRLLFSNNQEQTVFPCLLPALRWNGLFLDVPIILKNAVEATQVEHKPYGQWISKVSKTPPNR